MSSLEHPQRRKEEVKLNQLTLPHRVPYLELTVVLISGAIWGILRGNVEAWAEVICITSSISVFISAFCGRTRITSYLTELGLVATGSMCVITARWLHDAGSNNVTYLVLKVVLFMVGLVFIESGVLTITRKTVAKLCVNHILTLQD